MDNMESIGDILKKTIDLGKQEPTPVMANATLPTAIKETEKIEARIKRSPYIPIPSDLFNIVRLITTPYKLTKKDMSDLKQGILPSITKIYKKEIEAGQLEFEFAKELDPNTALMERSVIATIQMAIKQQRFNPTFTLGEKVKLLEYTAEEIGRGGKLWTELDRAEKCLADGRYKLQNNKQGKEKIEAYGSIYANLIIKGEGKGKTYTALLNPEYLKLLSSPDDIQKHKHIRYPIHLLTDRDIGHYERNWIHWLLIVKGLTSTPNVETILKKTLNLPTQYYKRKEYCLDLLDKCLAIARREGFTVVIDTKGEGNKVYTSLLNSCNLEKIMETLSIDKKTLTKELGDVRKWQLTIRHTEGKGKRRPSYNFTTTDEELAQKIVNWGFDKYANFKIHTPRDKVYEQVKHTIIRLGGDKVREIFTRIGTSNDVFFKTTDSKTINLWTKFWNELKQAKQGKR